MGRFTLKQRAPRPGRRLLERFLVRHKISLRAAAAALSVAHPTVLGWVNAASVPELAMRKRIEAWTGGEVPVPSWDDPHEVTFVAPYKSSGTER